MEAAMQLETVVENLEQINREKKNADGVAQEVTPESKTAEGKDQSAETAN
jgi:uncharacterized protein (UPF0335 family)